MIKLQAMLSCNLKRMGVTKISCCFILMELLEGGSLQDILSACLFISFICLFMSAGWDDALSSLLCREKLNQKLRIV